MRLLTFAAVAVGLASAPALAAPASIEEVIEAPGPHGPLAGTLMPGERRSAPVLIVPGSGPTDRDGNNPLGVLAAPYRLLAQALAKRGFTTVRIDKRGMFGSRAALADANAVTIADYAVDIHSWVTAIRQRTGARCVWVLGHSEGGLVALVAAQQPGGICGLLLVASPGRRLGIVLREQLKANPANAPLLDQAFAAIAKLEAGEAVDAGSLHPALMPLFAPQVQGLMKSLLSYDPALLAAAIKKPVLIVQGSRDLQVSEADAKALAAANPPATLALLPGVNHVLKIVPSDDRAANFATYADAALPIAPAVVEAIVRFLRKAGEGRR